MQSEVREFGGCAIIAATLLIWSIGPQVHDLRYTALMAVSAFVSGIIVIKLLGKEVGPTRGRD